MKPLSRRRWIMKAGVLVPYAASAISAPGQLLLHRRKAFRTEPAGVTYLLEEDFEGTGTPSGWSGVGTYGFDYTTSPAPLVGTESAYISSNFGRVQYAGYGDHTDIWAFGVFSLTSISGEAKILWMYDPANTTNLDCYVALTSTGAIRVQHGSSSILSGTGLFTDSDVIAVWAHYVLSTGSGNGVVEGYLANGSQTKPGSPQASLSTGTQTSNMGSLRIERGTGGVLIVDKVRISSSEIGSNPA